MAGLPQDGSSDLGTVGNPIVVSGLEMPITATVGAAGTPSSDVVTVQGISGGTKIPVSVVDAIPAGANSVGTVGLDAGANSVGTVGLDAGSNLIGKVDINSGQVSIGASSTGGCSPFFNDAVADTVVEIKSSAGQLFGLRLKNTTNADAYLQVFALPSASVSLGTTSATFAIALAANETLVLPIMTPLSVGGTGISIAGTTDATGSTGAAISVFAMFA